MFQHTPFQRPAIPGDVLQDRGPFLFISPLPLPLYSAWTLVSNRFSLSDSIKEIGMQTQQQLRDFWDIGLPSQSAGFLNEVVFLASLIPCSWIYWSSVQQAEGVWTSNTHIHTLFLSLSVVHTLDLTESLIRCETMVVLLSLPHSKKPTAVLELNRWEITIL